MIFVLTSSFSLFFFFSSPLLFFSIYNYSFVLKIGVWTEDGLDIKDITWPENSPVPPAGVPEKFSLRVTFLDEPSFVSMNDPDNETGECKTSRAVRCRFAPEHQLIG